IPEQDKGAADRENQRLWGFWEPARPRPVAALPALILYDARDHFRDARVEVTLSDGTVHECTWTDATHCQYGKDTWHHFGPDTLDFDGTRLAILFMHPMQGAVVRAVFPRHPAAQKATLRYGLADASASSTNTSPVEVTLKQAGAIVGRVNVASE